MTAAANGNHSGSASTISAGIYCRISLAAIDDTTKTDDQARICRELCDRLGWKVVEDCGYPYPNGVYTDHARSAWQKNRKRPAWNKMLEDVDAGRINAIAVYHGDRLVRRPEDLADLLRLADSKGVKLASPTGTKNLDTERLELWIRAAFAEEESQRTSERRQSQYDRWRREGKVRPGGRGGRAFGFSTKGEVLPRDRCVIATRQEISEADIVREMAQRVLAGEPTGVIARDISARGWRTPTGRPFGHSTVRKMLARPRYAGLMPDGISPAAWEPVLDRETWEAVCAMLDGRAAGFSYATNARRWLLTGLAACGECGSALQVRGEGRRAHDDGAQCVRRSCGLSHHWQSAPELTGYGCVRPGCRKVQRNAVLLDAYVTGHVIRRLAHEANPEPRGPEAPALAAQFGALTEQKAETEAAIADPAQGGRVRLLLARLDAIDRRLAQLRELSGEDAMSRLRRSHAGISREEFAALPLAVRRSLVSACVEVVVLPASRRGPGFRAEDVRVTTRP